MELHYKNGVYFMVGLTDTDVMYKYGMHWNVYGYKNVWSTTDRMVATALRKYAQPRLRLRLDSYAIRFRKSYELSRAKDTSPITGLTPPAGEAFLPYQIAGITYLLTRPASLLADDMGLGKTCQALSAARVLIKKDKVHRVLVICPASLKINWYREVKKWIPEAINVHILKSKDNVPEGDGIHIINYDIIDRVKGLIATNGKKLTCIAHYDLVILDECHYIKNISTKRSKLVQVLDAPRRFALSGTPMPNSVKELYAILHWLDPVMFGSQWYFWQEFCEVSQKYGHMSVTGGKNLKKLGRKLRATLMCRRMKADVLPDLPPKIRQIIELPNPNTNTTEQELNAYDKYETLMQKKRELQANDLEEHYDNLETLSLISKQIKIAFTELAIVRKKLSVLKIPVCTERLEAMLEQLGEKEKIIVFTYHKELASALHGGVSSRRLITGDTSKKTRQQFVDEFETDPSVRVIIGTVGALGVGWNLTVAKHMLICELDWTPMAMEQAEDRFYRIGQDGSVHVIYALFADSLDMRLAAKLAEKNKIITAVME